MCSNGITPFVRMICTMSPIEIPWHRVGMNVCLECNSNAFRVRIVLPPCDCSEWRNYFSATLDEIGLKKWISAGYALGSKKTKLLVESTFFHFSDFRSSFP